MRSFADLIAPAKLDAFLAAQHKTHFHIRGKQGRYAKKIRLSELRDLLNAPGIWTGNTLRIVKRNQLVPPSQYCTPQRARGYAGQVECPDLARVRALWDEGHTIICDLIDDVHGGVSELCAMVEAELGGKARANMYLTPAGESGFGAHFDLHDVIVLQIQGSKNWTIWDRVEEEPIYTDDFRRKASQPAPAPLRPLEEITLSAGDFLYVPRGRYHSARGSNTDSVHVTISHDVPIGLDIVEFLLRVGPTRKRLRRKLSAGKDGKSAAVQEIISELKDVADDPAFQRNLEAYLAAKYHVPRSRSDLF